MICTLKSSVNTGPFLTERWPIALQLLHRIYLMTQSSDSENPWIRQSLFWLLSSSLVLLVITFSPISSLLNLFHDDSFFYMVIARNHAAGVGYSFDGLNLTNGFHLLWLWVLSFVGSFIALTEDQGIRLVVALQTILSLGAALIYVRLLKIYKVPGVIQVVFFLAYISLCTLADIGQESALYGFLVALIISVILSARNERPIQVSLLTISATLVLGILIVLSRLDSVFLLGGIALSLLLAQRKTQAFALILGMAIGLAVTVSFNYLVFGHSYSISSWLKSGFDFGKTMQLLIPGLLLRVLLILTLLASALWQLKRARVFSGLQSTWASIPFIAILTTCILLSYSAYFAVLFLEVSALGSWYFNQALGLSVFLYALTLSQSGAGSKSKMWFIPLMLAFAIGGALFITKFFWAHSSAATKEIGEWIYQNNKPNTVIFQRDGAGAVSYFAQRHIINGDGLVNNMQYQVMLRSGKLCDYLKEQKVQYIVSNTFTNSADQVQDYIFLWTKGLTSIPLTDVAASQALYTSSAAPTYRLFRIEDAGTGCAP